MIFQFSLLSARSSVQYTVYSVHCTLYTVDCTLILHYTGRISTEPQQWQQHFPPRPLPAEVNTFPDTLVYLVHSTVVYCCPHFLCCGVPGAKKCTYECSYVLPNSYERSYVLPNWYVCACLCSQTRMCPCMYSQTSICGHMCPFICSQAYLCTDLCNNKIIRE